MNGEPGSTRQDSGAQWRATVEALWDAVAALREEHAAHRRRDGSPRATTKEIAEAIGVSDRTLGDWLRKRTVVPDWYELRKLVEFLGGDPDDWLPRWQHAKAAYDNRPRRQSTRPEPPRSEHGVEPASAPGRPHRRRTIVIVLLCALPVLLVLALVGIPVLFAWLAGASSGDRPTGHEAHIRNTWSTSQDKDVGVLTSSDPVHSRRDGPGYFLGTSVRVVCQYRHGIHVRDPSHPGQRSSTWYQLDNRYWISALYTDLPADPPPPDVPGCG
jgi:transcriptional regulator with XRE-family HTH domain